MAFKLVDVCTVYMFMLYLDARSQWVGKWEKISVELSRQLRKQISIKLETKVGHFYMNLTLKTLMWLDHLVLGSSVSELEAERM